MAQVAESDFWDGYRRGLEDARREAAVDDHYWRAEVRAMRARRVFVFLLGLGLGLGLGMYL